MLTSRVIMIQGEVPQVISTLWDQVSWVSRLQKIVTLSTTEAEYVAVTEAALEMIWLKAFLGELGLKQEDSVLFSDSQSAIHLAKNPVFHARTKHIDLTFHSLAFGGRRVVT